MKTGAHKTVYVIQARSSEWSGHFHKWEDFMTRSSKENINLAKTEKYQGVMNYKDLAVFSFPVKDAATFEFRTIRREISEFVEEDNENSEREG